MEHEFTKHLKEKKMKLHKCYLFYILICGINITSCTNSETQTIQLTLEQAGEREIELKKALSYYGQEKDSLKRKAMFFLLRHMYVHHSYQSEQMNVLNKALNKMDSLLVRQTNPGMKKYSDFRLFSSIVDSMHYNMPIKRQDRVEIKWDSQTVTANFLIQNIEFSFHAWQTNPWAKDVDFETFCEYILPYRLENEQIEQWRPQFYNEYSRRGGKFRGVTNMKQAGAMQAISLHIQTGIEAIYPYSMNISAIELMQMGRCYDIVRYRAMVLRSMGIPATMDYVPHWGNYTGKHGILRIVTIKQEQLLKNNNSPENTSLLFGSTSFLQGKKLNIEEGDLPEGVEVQYSKTLPKVYRYTWSVQPDRKHLLEIADKEEIISNFLLYIKDVTDEYVSCSDVQIKVNKSNCHIGYLCVSERGEWVPVNCSEITSNGDVIFQNMGRNIIYLPAVYKNKLMEPAGAPFYLDEKGKIHHLLVNSKDIQDVCLSAKYTFFSYTAAHAIKLKGGYFEGSNRRDFNDAKKIAVIKGIPYYRQKIVIKTPNKYRYIRFVAPEEKDCCIAELSFIGTDLKGGSTLLQPFRFYDGTNENEKINILKDKKYDGFYTMATKHLITDLGSPQRLTCIEVIPRSNTNGIIPGHQYELFYWAGKEGWISLGKQTATDWRLKYKQVPVQALLWLKCLNGGKEERLFTYEHGKQKWW